MSYGTLRTFIDRHADSRDALNNWYRFVLQADWSNFHDIRTVYIRFVGTHAEYSKSKRRQHNLNPPIF